jgi:hypothetical protein
MSISASLQGTLYLAYALASGYCAYSIVGSIFPIRKNKKVNENLKYNVPIPFLSFYILVGMIICLLDLCSKADGFFGVEDVMLIQYLFENISKLPANGIFFFIGCIGELVFGFAIIVCIIVASYFNPKKDEDKIMKFISSGGMEMPTPVVVKEQKKS